MAEHHALSVQFRELLENFCGVHGVVQLTEEQYRATGDEGLLIAQPAQCAGQPGDTEADVLAQFVSNLELNGLREETTAIYCCIKTDEVPEATQYTARVYEF